MSQWSVVLKITPTPSASRPALIYYQFVFELGHCDSEVQAREVWKSLGFTLPKDRNIELVFSNEVVQHYTAGGSA